MKRTVPPVVIFVGALTWAGVPHAACLRTTSSLTSRSTSLQFSAA